MEPQTPTRAALSLPESRRADTAVSLSERLAPRPDSDAEAQWTDEINRRIRSLDSGTAKLFPAVDVFAEMKRRRDG